MKLRKFALALSSLALAAASFAASADILFTNLGNKRHRQQWAATM